VWRLHHRQPDPVFSAAGRGERTDRHSPKRLDLAAAGHGSGSRFCAQIKIGTQRQRDRVSGAINSTMSQITDLAEAAGSGASGSGASESGTSASGSGASGSASQINIGTARQRDRVSGALNSALANISADARSADRDIDFALHARASRAAGGEDADERGTRTTTRKKRSRS
jgi:hypothetical protein